MNINDWPDCPNQCGNKVCTWAFTGLCYPCSEKIYGKEIMDLCYQSMHKDGKLNPELEGIETD